MWQFMYGSDDMFADLEEKAGHACIRFSNQEMPPGTVPARASIGFEVDTLTNRVYLLVDRNLNYDGPISEVREWLDSGIKKFGDFGQLRSWCGTTLRDAFRGVHTEADPHLEIDVSPNLTPDRHLDQVESRAFRLATRLGCRLKDIPS